MPNNVNRTYHLILLYLGLNGSLIVNNKSTYIQQFKISNVIEVYCTSKTMLYIYIDDVVYLSASKNI